MPPNVVNTLNCLILQSKNSLRQLPPNSSFYFVNSKRRFFVYFRHAPQMIETMKVLNDKGVKFYRRESLLFDREELQEIVYHCNYKFKKQDLRKNLSLSTPYNTPKVHFEKYQRIKDQQIQKENTTIAQQLNPTILNVSESLQKRKSIQSQINQKQKEEKEEKDPLTHQSQTTNEIHQTQHQLHKEIIEYSPSKKDKTNEAIEKGSKNQQHSKLQGQLELEKTSTIKQVVKKDQMEVQQRKEIFSPNKHPIEDKMEIYRPKQVQKMRIQQNTANKEMQQENKPSQQQNLSLQENILEPIQKQFKHKQIVDILANKQLLAKIFATIKFND